MKDRHSMQVVFEHIALQSRGEHGMLCDFRKDFSGNYMSACERAAFWAWSKVEHLHSFEGRTEDCIGSVVRSLDTAKKHDDFAGDDLIVSFDLAKGKDSTVATKIISKDNGLDVLDVVSLPPKEHRQETRMFDRLPNRNGRVYLQSAPKFNELPAETQAALMEGVDRIGGEGPFSISVTTMNDIPKQGEKQMVYNIDQLAFLPELKDIPFCEENSKRLDEAFNKLRGKLADSVQKDYNISLESPYSKPLYKTIPEADQFKSLEDAENVEMNLKTEAQENEAETPVFKPIHSLY